MKTFLNDNDGLNLLDFAVSTFTVGYFTLIGYTVMRNRYNHKNTKDLVELIKYMSGPMSASLASVGCYYSAQHIANKMHSKKNENNRENDE